MAHEMAHQRGIAREEEANFAAYLVCVCSDDAYIRYSGYLSMLDEIRGGINKYEPGRGDRLIPSEVRTEYAGYYSFFKKYVESKPAKVTEKVYDNYQQIQGQKEGINSYGLVVRYAVALNNKGTLATGEI